MRTIFEQRNGIVLLVITSLLMTGCTPENITAASVVDYGINDGGNISVFFCPREDCEGEFVAFLSKAQQALDCALYDITLPSVQQLLLEKAKTMPVRVVTDNENTKKFNHSFVREDTWGLMHHKFCVVDGVMVSSGSMNPTLNDAFKNNNNLLLIGSETLAQNYQEKFEEMWSGTFKGGDHTVNPTVIAQTGPIKNYFCPVDDCAAHVKEELKKAQHSIYFMTFSFTHDGIGNILLLKHLDHVVMQGVMEVKQISKDSEYQRLVYGGIDVLKDANPHNVHHKVFIIDEEVVVTGSFNPTAGGDERNDENLLIIRNRAMAARFIEEFDYVYGEAVNGTKGK